MVDIFPVKCFNFSISKLKSKDIPTARSLLSSEELGLLTAVGF